MNTTKSRSIETPAEKAPDLDELFKPRDKGYLGADGALSIPIDGERTLWVFGDTLVGEMADGRRQISAMPRNSIALQDRRLEGPASIQFHWRERDGLADSFFDITGIFPDEWFWAGTGLMHGGRLHLFGYRVGEGTSEIPALAFTVRGMIHVIVSNPLAHPKEWVCQYLPILSDAINDFHVSAHAIKNSYIHFAGVRFDSLSYTGSSVMTLTRFPLELLEQSGDRGGHSPFSRPSRSSSVDDRESLTRDVFSPGVTECSIQYLESHDRFIMTTYHPKIPSMMIRHARHLTGPWSQPIVMHALPQSECSETFLYYAFRAHPSLSRRPDELVFTHVVNDFLIDRVLEDPGIYYPRFLRVNLNEILFNE